MNCIGISQPTVYRIQYGSLNRGLYTSIYLERRGVAACIARRCRKSRFADCCAIYDLRLPTVEYNNRINGDWLRSEP